MVIRPEHRWPSAAPRGWRAIPYYAIFYLLAAITVVVLLPLAWVTTKIQDMRRR